MFQSMFNKETFKILKNKKLIIAVMAVLMVPILYAGMFLWAFWDPYAYLEDVPVAVVNEDKGYEYEGEHLQIGDELIDKLKEESAFDFHFVDKKQGYEGLNQQDYYILIEIPENFSENATTVLDEPQKLELIYVPNESFNFLAAQMGETAMLQIQQALQEEITETYATTVLEKIDDAKEMLVEAKDATTTLNDGAVELADGTTLLSTNMVTIAEKMEAFTAGVETAKNGVNELGSGAGSLASGVSELYSNSEKLTDASGDLKIGADKVADGMKIANDGVHALKENIPALISGTEEVENGLETFETVLPQKIGEKVKETFFTKKDPIRERLHDGLTAKKAELSPVIAKRLTEEIAQGATEEVVTAANKMIAAAPEGIADKIATDITEFIQGTLGSHSDIMKAEMEEILNQAGASEEVIAAALEKVNQLTPDYAALEAMIDQQINTTLANALADVEITAEQQKQLENRIKEKAEQKIASGVNEALDQAIVHADKTIEDYEEKLTANMDGIAGQIEQEMKAALQEPIGQLKAGLIEINKGQKQLFAGVDDLSDGTKELAAGATDLSQGQENYVANMEKFTANFRGANEGAKQLASGTEELEDGMETLTDGANQLQDGAGQLAKGSIELVDGMAELTEGTAEFEAEMRTASDQATGLHISGKAKEMFASPVVVDNHKINEVPNYGTGFAPYFLSLGLFVGALLLSIVYPLKETSSSPSSGTEWFLRKFFVLGGIGVLQALVASLILLVGLGIEVQSVSRFILFAVLTSLTFITLIQFFVTVLDDPGRFIAIIILILQLTTSAGTFPLELIPKVLQPLNAVLPMTYSVAGLKAVISSGDYGAMWLNAGVLFIFMAIFITSTWVYFVMKHKKGMKKDQAVMA